MLTQKYMTFVIAPGSERRYNPSKTKLVFKAQIQKTDGTLLGDNDLPVDNFFKKLSLQI